MLATAAILISVELAAQAASRQEAPPAKIEAFLKQCETNRRGAILRLEHELRGLRQKGPQTPELIQRAKQIDEDLRSLYAGRHLVVPTLAFPPEIGAIGRLPRLSCHIDQAISGREVAGRCFFTVVTPSVRRFRSESERVTQPVEVILRGVSAQGLHGGVDAEFSQVFEVVGRRPGRVVDGRPTTCWVLDVFDLAQAERFLQANQ